MRRSRRVGSAASRRGLRSQELPRALDVALLRAQVADRQADREPVAQPRVRQEDLAGPVDRVHQPRVQVVEQVGHVALVLAPGEAAGR